MWQPAPGWQPLPGGSAPSTVGVWAATEGGREVVVKRLARPGPEDPPEVSDPRSSGWWRREVEVALAGTVAATPGLRSPLLVRCEEDDEGVVLVHERVAAPGPVPGLFAAACLGRFAGADLGGADLGGADLGGADPGGAGPGGAGVDGWLARGQLRERLARVERRGGWRALARTTVADVADHLWSRRAALLERLDRLPQVAQHGDPVPGNLATVDPLDDRRCVALDWSTLGRGPVGADLGYWSLSSREAFEPLLGAYLDALPAGLADPDDTAYAARATAVLTVLTRADWALARVAEGEGALAGKYRHPAVAPHLRALQRQFPQLEALL